MMVVVRHLAFSSSLLRVAHKQYQLETPAGGIISSQQDFFLVQWCMALPSTACATSSRTDRYRHSVTQLQTWKLSALPYFMLFYCLLCRLACWIGVSMLLGYCGYFYSLGQCWTVGHSGEIAWSKLSSASISFVVIWKPVLLQAGICVRCCCM